MDIDRLQFSPSVDEPIPCAIRGKVADHYIQHVALARTSVESKSPSQVSPELKTKKEAEI